MEKFLMALDRIVRSWGLLYTIPMSLISKQPQWNWLTYIPSSGIHAFQYIMHRGITWKLIAPRQDLGEDGGSDW